MISDVSSGTPTVRLCTCNRSPTAACMGTSLPGSDLNLRPSPARVEVCGRRAQSRCPAGTGRLALLTSCPEGLTCWPLGVAERRCTDMASRLDALCFDANDPDGLARFWSGVLGWEPMADPREGVTLLPDDDT